MRGLSICVLFEIFFGITTFYLNAMYWNSWISAFLLISLLNLSTTEQISDGNIKLIDFGYFPGCLQPSLFTAKGDGVKITCTWDVDIGSTYVKDVDTVKHL